MGYAGDDLRFARHEALAQIGAAGQHALGQARVLVVGLGGLGSPAAAYLAAAGVGHLSLNDFDTVDVTNLQRQPLFSVQDVGRRKAQVLCEALAAQNPRVSLLPIDERLAGSALAKTVAAHDLVLDGSDNFATRFAVNSACVAARKPLVSGAALRFAGQFCVFPNDDSESPCYRCLYGDEQPADDCQGAGVLGPLVGVIGTMMAVEAIKSILNLGDTGTTRLLRYDALAGEWRVSQLKRDHHCPVCGEDAR